MKIIINDTDHPKKFIKIQSKHKRDKDPIRKKPQEMNGPNRKRIKRNREECTRRGAFSQKIQGQTHTHIIEINETYVYISTNIVVNFRLLNNSAFKKLIFKPCI